MGCLRAVLVLAVLFALAAAALVFGGVGLISRVIPSIGELVPAITAYAGLAQRVREDNPGVGDVGVSLNVVNGRATLRLTIEVPFDPRADRARSRVLADRVADQARREAPREPRAERLEVRLVSENASGAVQTRSELGFEYPFEPAPPPQPKV